MKICAAKIRANNKEISIYHRIASMSVECLDRGNVSDTINYGIYSNRGNLKFIDFDKRFYNMIDGKVGNPPKISVRAFLSSEKDEKQITTLDVVNLIYEHETLTCSLELDDGLTLWQNKKMPEIYLFDDTTAYDALCKIMAEANEPIGFTREAEWRLKNLTIYCPRLVASTLWDNVTKICQISMCRVTRGSDGIAKISTDNDRNDRGRIFIRARDIIGTVGMTSSSKTAIPNANISITNRIKHFAEEIGRRAQFRAYTFAGNADSISWIGENAETKFLEASNGQAEDTSAWGVIEVPDSVHSLYFGQEDNELAVEANVLTGKNDMFKITKATSHLADESRGGLNLVQTSHTWDKSSGKAEVSFTNRSFIDAPIPYILLDGEIFLKGNFYTDSASVTQSYSTDDEQIEMEIPSNDLLQSGNLYGADRSNSEWILHTIEQQYKDGIMCAELDCLLSTYYDENGDPVTSGEWGRDNISVLEQFDVVVPYIMRNGFEQPLALNTDQTPKAFRIIGIKYQYSGRLKQRLFLQETT